MLLTEKIKDALSVKLIDPTLEIYDLTGGGDHMGINVSSSSFKGLSLIKQHQMVLDLLKELLKDELHAVKISTTVKEE